MNKQLSNISHQLSTNDIAVIILAAGQGRRIGTPKWKLKIKKKTFLDIIYDKLKKVGINNIYCTYREESLPEKLDIKYILNKTPEYGMISSIYYGIQTAPKFSGYMIWPVDHPFTSIETLSILCEKFQNKQNMLRPIYGNRGGHPIIIPHQLADIIPVDYDGGIKNFFIENNISIQDVEVNDSDIKSNINYKENLAEYI